MFHQLLADVTISNNEVMKGLGRVGAGVGYGAAAIGPGIGIGINDENRSASQGVGARVLRRVDGSIYENGWRPAVHGFSAVRLAPSSTRSRAALPGENRDRGLVWPDFDPPFAGADGSNRTNR